MKTKLRFQQGTITYKQWSNTFGNETLRNSKTEKTVTQINKSEDGFNCRLDTAEE